MSKSEHLDLKSPDNQSIHSPWSIFPAGTRLVGPVVVLQKSKPGISIMGTTSTKPMVLLSEKLIFPNGTEVVVGREMRNLWAGAEGAAFDCAPETKRKIAAISHNGIVTGANMPLN